MQAKGGAQQCGRVKETHPTHRPAQHHTNTTQTRDNRTRLKFTLEGGYTATARRKSRRTQLWRATAPAASITIPANIRLRETFTDDAGRVIAGWAYNTTTQRYLGYVATLPLACEYEHMRLLFRAVSNFWREAHPDLGPDSLPFNGHPAS